jgi:hypothetical protein
LLEPVPVPSPAPRIAALAVLLLLLATACATALVTTPRSRVAKDLGCTTEATSVEELARVPGEQAARWQVTGCGRTAVYLCTTPVRDCWREGEVAPQAQTPK